MSIDEDLFKLVPLGEENAVSARLIWQQYETWSSAGIRYKLNEMAAAGTIKRKRIEQMTGSTFRYYR